MAAELRMWAGARKSNEASTRARKPLLARPKSVSRRRSGTSPPPEELRGEAEQLRDGEPDDVPEVAVDGLDERGAAALDRVRPRAPLPLAGGDVPVDLVGLEQ